MHKIYENDDLMMYLKKRYCRYCGNVLSIKRTERVVKKGDPDHDVYCHIGRYYRPYGDILVVGSSYYCVACHRKISCSKQSQVIAAQKFYKKKIVSKQEIEDVQKLIAKKHIEKILNLRWSLFLPGIGGLLCHYYTSSDASKDKTQKNSHSKLLILSIFLFFAIGLILKLATTILDYVDFIDKYKSIIMLIPSMYVFNIPYLIYINKNFKNKKPF